MLYITRTFVLLGAVCLSSAAPGFAQDWYDDYDFASKGVAAYWPLDGNADDVTGNGNTGTVNGPVPADGRFAQAYEFDGMGDHIRVDTTLMNGFSAVTMACWVKADSLYEMGDFISRGGRDGDYGPGDIGAYPDFATFSVSTVWDESQSLGTSGLSALTTGTWYHVAGTYDGESMRLYLNGVELVEVPKWPAGNLVSNSQILFIGNDDVYGYTCGFDGIIDEAAIFERALSAPEIWALASDVDSSGVADFWEDDDFDGMPNYWEMLHGLDPNDDGSGDPNHGPDGDPDDDGLSNFGEYEHSGDPLNANTDGDAADDGQEAAVGTDLTNPCSCPPPAGWDGIVYVDKDNEYGQRDGWFWETASQTIQEGIDYAAKAIRANTLELHAEVWVAEGTYQGTGDPVIVMRPKVDVYGGFDGTENERSHRDWVNHFTVVDGEDTRRCVFGAHNAVLDGFTITRGNAGSGGGMFNAHTSPTVSNCIFLGNSAGEGGGMMNLFASPTVVNCIFDGNESQGWGGGMENNNSTPTVVNCTFYGNYSVTNVAGGMYNEYQSPTVRNCIFWDNLPGNIGGGYSGEANVIGVDPLFVDAANDDFHLSPGSPCIDTGTGTGAPAMDLDGRNRPVDMPGVGADGTGTEYDMGAYEFSHVGVGVREGEREVKGERQGEGDDLSFIAAELLAQWDSIDPNGTRTCCLGEAWLAFPELAPGTFQQLDLDYDGELSEAELRAVAWADTDVNSDAAINAVDVQLVINEALGLSTGYPCDLNGDSSIDAVDIQLVINAALGIT